MDPWSDPALIAADLDEVAARCDACRVTVAADSWPDLLLDELVDVVEAAAALLATGADRLTLMLADRHLQRAAELAGMVADACVPIGQARATLVLAAAGVQVVRGR